MKITGTALKLAAISTVLLLLTAAVIVIFGQVRFDRTHRYSADFENVSGLRTGQFVRASGVEIGKVAGIQRIPGADAIRVDFDIDRSLALNESTTAVIRYADLIGNRYLELQYHPDGQTGGTLAPGAVIPLNRTQPALDLDALIGGFKPLFRAMDPAKVNNIATSLITIFQDQGGTIGDILDQTALLANSLATHDQAIGEVITDLNTLLATTTEHRSELDQTLGHLEQVIGTLRERAEPLADATARISRVSGSLADLLSDNRPALQREMADGQAILDSLLVGQGSDLTNLLVKMPAALKIIGRTGGIYGDFFNFYLCDISLKLNGLQPGGPVRTVKLTGQPTGRCTPK